MAVVPITPYPPNLTTAQAVRGTSVDFGREKLGAAIDAADTTDAGIKQRVWGLAARVDESVTFEEYVYWAKIERELEIEENKRYIAERGPKTLTGIIKNRFSKGVHHDSQQKEDKERRERALQPLEESQESKPGLTMQIMEPASVGQVKVTDEEWRTAARALRTASWGTIFFLVTTDILGWSSCPYVFASVGYGPGIALYIIFGLFAAFSGYAIWRVFCGLDSSRYPMMSFGDTFFRVFGKRTRHFINVLQSIQQFCTVAVLILGNSTVIAQIASEKICFIAVMIIVMVVGMLVGSIRSLQRLGWLCNASVWCNVINFIIIMYAAANNPIDYQAVFASTLFTTKEPIKTFSGPPPAQYQQQVPGFASQFNAVDSMVYAYSGALLFVAFLGEMRHPLDFWKGMLMAQVFICLVYLLFGVFVYSQLGQYAIFNIGNVIEPFGLQTVGNVFTLITGFIAVFLYFNIGMKTVYLEVFQEVLHFPAITTKKGKWMWFALGPIYWILAFLFAAAVPNLSGLVNVIGGLFGLNFTYTFPGLLFVGYMIQRGAELPGEGFDPATGTTVRHDRGLKRWIRGFMKNFLLNTFTSLYFIGGLVCSGMGTWAGIEGLISIFGPGGTVATSFGCASPV